MNIDYINSFLSLFHLKVLSSINRYGISYIYDKKDKIVGKIFINSKGVLSVKALYNDYFLTAKIHFKQGECMINYLLKHNKYNKKLSGGLIISNLGKIHSIAILNDDKKILKLKANSLENKMFFELLDSQERVDLKPNSFSHRFDMDFTEVKLEKDDDMFYYSRKSDFEDDLDGGYLYKDEDVNAEFLEMIGDIDEEYINLVNDLKNEFRYFDEDLYEKILEDTCGTKSREKLLSWMSNNN